MRGDLSLAGSIVAVLVLAQTLAAEQKTPTPPGADSPDRRPAWARIAEPPLWSFVWASDLHVEQSRREFIAKALHYIDEELKPRFVLITGDNNALPAPPADRNRPEPLGLRRQRFLKAFLQEHLKAPYAILPGDNWLQDFDKVFGARQYSFDFGGLHFLVLDPDRSWHGKGAEGLSVFDESTLEWIRRDLDRTRRSPVIVAIHEPMCPCTFLDAGRLRELLDRYPHVIAALQGHLHVDMEFRAPGRTYLVAPSLGKSPVRAMKWILVYPHILLVRTIRYQESIDQFQATDRWQKIEVPESLRGGLVRPVGAGFVMGNYDAAPPRPHREDPTLAGRTGELLRLIQQSVGKDAWLWR